LLRDGYTRPFARPLFNVSDDGLGAKWYYNISGPLDLTLGTSIICRARKQAVPNFLREVA